jgi:hypothetical protein
MVAYRKKQNKFYKEDSPTLKKLFGVNGTSKKGLTNDEKAYAMSMSHKRAKGESVKYTKAEYDSYMKAKAAPLKAKRDKRAAINKRKAERKEKQKAIEARKKDRLKAKAKKEKDAAAKKAAKAKKAEKAKK